MEDTDRGIVAAVIVLAGGSGTRMGTAGSKILAEVEGRPVIAYSVETCRAAPSVQRCVIVAHPSIRDAVDAIVEPYLPDLDIDVIAAEPDGDRHFSEQLGLRHVDSEVGLASVDVIAVHDAARPFATVEMYEASFLAAYRHGGAVPAVELPQPVVDWSGRRPVLDDGHLMAVQTPQTFKATLLQESFGRSFVPLGAPPVGGRAPVDTADAVQRFGGEAQVVAVDGDARNIKITYEADLERAAALARRWAAGRWVRDLL